MKNAVNRALEAMKAMRYILIVMSLVSVLSVSAHTPILSDWGKQPVAQMYSTSTMAGSGSSLPQAAITGSYVTGSYAGTYSPAHTPGVRPRRAVDEDDENDKPSTAWQEPMNDPLGDALWPLMVMALAYITLRVTRKRFRASRQL